MLSSNGGIRIEPRNGGWRLTTETRIPRCRQEVFAFFAKAENLEKLTPSFIQFQIVTPRPIEMEKGVVIDYKLKLRGLPIGWRTLISCWEPDQRFVDEQVRGPYRQWRHEHRFEAVGEETSMTDTVDYRLWLGWLFHPLVVRRDLTRIFEYRRVRIQEIFAGNCH